MNKWEKLRESIEYKINGDCPPLLDDHRAIYEYVLDVMTEIETEGHLTTSTTVSESEAKRPRITEQQHIEMLSILQALLNVHSDINEKPKHQYQDGEEHMRAFAQIAARNQCAKELLRLLGFDPHNYVDNKP